MRSFGPCRSYEHADRTAGFRLDCADRLHPLAVVGRRAVAEIEAEDVDAAVKQRMDHRRRGTCRSECRDDFCVALAAHPVPSEKRVKGGFCPIRDYGR
jgi:hypothetical protein